MPDLPHGRGGEDHLVDEVRVHSVTDKFAIWR